MDYEQQEVRMPDASRRKPGPSGSAQQQRRPAAPNGQQQRRPAAPNGQQQRRPAAPNGQQQRRPAAPDGQQQRRPAAPNGQQQRRPAAPNGQQMQRTAPAPEAQQQRTRSAAAAGQRRPAQRSGAAQTRAASGSHAAETAGQKRGLSIWRIGMTIYIVLFFIVILFLSRWIWVLCREYEDSQPKYTIDSYISELNEKDAASREAFYQNLMKEKISVLPLSQYETADSIYSTLEIQKPEDYKFSWKKNGRLYKDDKPVYYLNCGEAAIAQVELRRKGGTEKHDFPLWEVASVTSLIEVSSEPEYDLSVTMPAGASLTVNGIAVAPTVCTPAESPLVLDEKALQYAEQPTAQSCNITGLYAVPVVEAKDAAGRPLTLKEEPKEGEKHVSLVYEPAFEENTDDEFVQRVTNLTAAYINYVINKDEAQQRNFSELAKYLITKSTVYNAMTANMYEWGWNNPYTARKDGPTTVYHQEIYSENCCTCDVDYSYQLTKKVVNDYSGTLRWTLVKANDGKWYASNVETLKSSETRSNVG